MPANRWYCWSSQELPPTHTTEEPEKKAREEKKKQEQTEKQQREKKERFNRRINYFIMRYMWQVIREHKVDDTIYICLNMSRTRYTRILENHIVRIGKEELDFLEKKTGVHKEIFSGEKKFDCLDKHGNETIQLVEWEKLFELRDERQRLKANIKEADKADDSDRKAYEQVNSDYKKAEEAIEKKLANAERKGNTSFQRFCSFLKNGYGSRLERLQDIRQAVGQVGLTLLDECSRQELEELYRALTQKAKMVNAVLLYRGVRGDFKKNKKK